MELWEKYLGGSISIFEVKIRLEHEIEKGGSNKHLQAAKMAYRCLVEVTASENPYQYRKDFKEWLAKNDSSTTKKVRDVINRIISAILSFDKEDLWKDLKIGDKVYALPTRCIGKIISIDKETSYTIDQGEGVTCGYEGHELRPIGFFGSVTPSKWRIERYGDWIE